MDDPSAGLSSQFYYVPSGMIVHEVIWHEIENLVYGHQVANNEDAGTKCIPPDIQAVEKLRKMNKDGIVVVENQNLELDPQSIPAGEFIVNGSYDLLHQEIWAAGGGSNWKKHGREIGWGIWSHDGREIVGFKRTFVFHRNDGTKTDWIMNVYAMVEGVYINNTKFLCQVFQNEAYDPRPPLRRWYPRDFVADANNRSSSSSSSSIQGDFRPAAQPLSPGSAQRQAQMMVELEKYMLEGDENCDPNAAAGSSSSTGIAPAKKRKCEVLSDFTEIHASDLAGNKLSLFICNRCGMAYSKNSGTGTRGKHKCNGH